MGQTPAAQPTREQFDAAAQQVMKTAPAGLSKDDFYKLIDKELAKTAPASATGMQRVKPAEPTAGGFLRNAVSDAGNVIKGAYNTGQAAMQDPVGVMRQLPAGIINRIKQVGRDIHPHDAMVQLREGRPGAAIANMLPVHEAYERPVSMAADLYGGAQLAKLGTSMIRRVGTGSATGATVAGEGAAEAAATRPAPAPIERPAPPPVTDETGRVIAPAQPELSPRPTGPHEANSGDGPNPADFQNVMEDELKQQFGKSERVAPAASPVVESVQGGAMSTPKMQIKVGRDPHGFKAEILDEDGSPFGTAFGNTAEEAIEEAKNLDRDGLRRGGEKPRPDTDYIIDNGDTGSGGGTPPDPRDPPVEGQPAEPAPRNKQDATAEAAPTAPDPALSADSPFSGDMPRDWHLSDTMDGALAGPDEVRQANALHRETGEMDHRSNDLTGETMDLGSVTDPIAILGKLGYQMMKEYTKEQLSKGWSDDAVGRTAGRGVAAAKKLPAFGAITRLTRPEDREPDKEY